MRSDGKPLILKYCDIEPVSYTHLRDGVHDRYYLIHKPGTSPEVLAEADLCIQDVLNGTARENHSAYPTVVRNHNGTPFLPDQLLERYLTGLLLKKFP